MGSYSLSSLYFMLAGFGGTALVYVSSRCSTWEQIRVNFALPSLRMRPGSIWCPAPGVEFLRAHNPGVRHFEDREEMWVQMLTHFHKDTLFAVLERHIFRAIPCLFCNCGKCKGLESPLLGSVICSALILRSIFLNSGYASPRLSGFRLSCWVLWGRLDGAWIFAFA